MDEHMIAVKIWRNVGIIMHKKHQQSVCVWLYGAAWKTRSTEFEYINQCKQQAV